MSSSEDAWSRDQVDGRFERSIPAGGWLRAGLIGVILAVVGIGVWEVQVRGQEYLPSINDTADRWAHRRSQITPTSTVVIGSSRIQFDLDLDVYAEATGERPIQLAMVGTNPLGLVEHLAADESFRGTLILGATPALWFVPQGPPVQSAEQAVGRYENWSPSQRVGMHLAGGFQQTFAFINQEDLTLSHLLRRIPLPERKAATPNVPPAMPPHFGDMDPERQIRMWEKCDFGTPRAQEVQAAWKRLFAPPPPPPHMTPEEFQAMMQKGAEATIERIAAAIGSLRERGVTVVWVRPPSTGWVREFEQQMAPRERSWDLFLQVSEAPGIHFEDHPELAGFDCPEWSHLTAEDATRFTQALMPLLRELLAPS